MQKGWERDMIGLMNDLPKDKDGPSGYAQNSAHAQDGAREQDGGGGILQKIILLTMPVLDLHLNVLGAIKNNIIRGHKAAIPGRDDSGNEGSIIDHLHRFAAVQLHVIGMIADKNHKLRGYIDLEHQEKLQAEIKEISNKVASGSVSLIEAQEKVIQNLIGVMTKIKNGKPAPGPTGPSKSAY
jgi:hypothetical protein